MCVCICESVLWICIIHRWHARGVQTEEALIPLTSEPLTEEALLDSLTLAAPKSEPLTEETLTARPRAEETDL